MDKWLKTIEKRGGKSEIETYRSALEICGNNIVTEGSGWYDEFEEGEFRSRRVKKLSRAVNACK